MCVVKDEWPAVTVQQFVVMSKRWNVSIVLHTFWLVLSLLLHA